MNEGESIVAYIARVQKVVLKSLTPKLDQVVIVMEQSRVTKKMDCEELITSLMDQ